MKPYQDVDENEDNESGLASVQAFLLPALRMRRMIALITLLGLAIGFALSAIQPNVYESNAKLFVRFGAREEATVESALVASGRSSFANLNEAMNNELHILTTPGVYGEVVRRVGADEILQPYDPAAIDDATTPTHIRWLHQAQSWWFARFGGAEEQLGTTDTHDLASRLVAANMRITIEPGSCVISVSYATHLPQLACDVVDAFLQVAMERHRQVFATDTSVDFMKLQAEQALAESRRADEALTNYRLSCGIFDFAAQRTSLLTAKERVEREIGEDVVRIQSLTELTKLLEQQVEAEQKGEERHSSNTPNPEHARLRQRLLELRGDKSEVGSGRGETLSQLSARHRALDEQIRDVEHALAGEPEFLGNLRRDRLQTRLDEARQSLIELQAASKQRLERQTAVNAQLVELEKCEPKHRVLSMESEQNHTRAIALAASLDQLRRISTLDEVKMSNMRVLQPAELPLTKSGPKRSKLLVIGGILGACCGFAFALTRNALDRYVRRPADIATRFRVPLLAVMPDSSAWRVKAGALRKRSSR